MSVGAIVAVVTLVVVLAIYMGYTIGEMSEMRRTLDMLERRQKLRDMQEHTPTVWKRDIGVLTYE